MRKLSTLFIGAVMLASCGEEFKKGDEGLEYKLIKSGNGPQVKYGEFLQMQVAQYRRRGEKDSLLQDSRKSVPFIESIDSTSIPPAYFKILSTLHVGDSMIIRIPTDSAFKQNPMSVPPFFKKNDYLLTTIMVQDIFKDRNAADVARRTAADKAENESLQRSKVQMTTDDKILVDYLKKNNIEAQKSAKGVYVQILQQGEGPAIDTSVVVKTRYRGTLLNGKEFDGNIGKGEPLPVNLTNDPTLGVGVIEGWKEGLMMLKKGAKAKFFIPSPLAYGERGAGEDIPANSPLIFDIEVVDVINKVQAKAEAQAIMKKLQDERQKMMEQQKQKADSTKK